MTTALSGELSMVSVSELALFLGNKRATGRLSLTRGSIKKSVTVREGHVRSSASNDPRELLGQFMLNLGHITEDQFEKAYQTQQETKIMLGKILVMTGQVSDELVQQTLTVKARETVLEAFGWKEGTFRFVRGEEAQAAESDLDVPLLDVHREGEFRTEAWAAIRQELPSGTARLVADEAKWPASAGSFDARLLTLIKQGHTADDLLLTLHATDFFLYQRLYSLIRMGALRTDREGVITVPPPIAKSSVEPLSVAVFEERIRSLLSEGKRSEADELRSDAAVLHPDHDWVEVIQRADDELLSALREKLAADKAIPSLLVPMKTLYSLEVTAPARYLLSRVNGERSVEAIVRASPLPEAEGLRLFGELVKANLVQLKA